MNTELGKSEIESTNIKAGEYVYLTCITEETQLRYLISKLPPATAAPLLGYLYNHLHFPEESEVYLFHSFHENSLSNVQDIPFEAWIAVGGLWMRKRGGVEKPNTQLRFFNDALESKARNYSVFQKLLKMAKPLLLTTSTQEPVPYWLPAQSESHTKLLELQGIKFNWTEPYDCYVQHNYSLDPVSIEKEFEVSLDRILETETSPLLDDLRSKSFFLRCKVDHLKLDDIPTILSQKTVGYSSDYLEYLINTSPFNLLNYCLRIVEVSSATKVDEQFQDLLPKVGDVITWSITHQDFSTGLVGTLPAYRGLGLAKHVVKQTLNAQYFHFRSKELPVISFGFVSPTNSSSQRLFSSLGYTVGESVNWVGLDV
jgi:ribosomal protein S18 acetylase RimI-like enzyme